MTTIRLTHVPSGTLLAEGPKGFGGITWWRVALPGNHPEVLVEEVEETEA
jgi:hypothetical protein